METEFIVIGMGITIALSILAYQLGKIRKSKDNIDLLDLINDNIKFDKISTEYFDDFEKRISELEAKYNSLHLLLDEIKSTVHSNNKSNIEKLNSIKTTVENAIKKQNSN